MDAILLKVGDMRKSHARRLSTAAPPREPNEMEDRWNSRQQRGAGYSRDTVILPTLPERALVTAGLQNLQNDPRYDA